MKKSTVRQESVGSKINKMKINPWMVALFGFIVFVGVSMAMNGNERNTFNSSASGYKPKIKAKDFTTQITNEYFSLPPGKKMIYMVQTEEGLEKIEIEILERTKMIMGVNTRVYWDRVWLDTNGDNKFSKKEMIEETFDYLAQDKKGNVWYFGEEVDNYVDGKLIDHEGSWIAGQDLAGIDEKAQPGIWIKGSHRVRDSYRQEFYKGEAEDQRDVVATDITVKTKMRSYTDCVQFYDWTPLDPESREYKYYCPQVGALVASEHLDEDKNVIDRTELVKVQMVDDDEDNQEDDEDNDKDSD